MLESAPIPAGCSPARRFRSSQASLHHNEGRRRFHLVWPRPGNWRRLRFDLGCVVWTRISRILELSQSIRKPIQVLEHCPARRYFIEWLRLTRQSGEEYPPLNFIAGRITLTQSCVIYFTRMKNVRSQRESLLIACSDIDDEGMLREKFVRRRQPLRPANKIKIDCYSRRQLAQIMNLDFDITRCQIIAIKAAPAGLPMLRAEPISFAETPMELADANCLGAAASV